MESDVPQDTQRVTWTHKVSVGLCSQCSACGALVANTHDAHVRHERFHEGVWHTLRALSLMRENVIDLLALESDEPEPPPVSRNGRLRAPGRRR